MCFRKYLFAICDHLVLEIYQRVNRVYKSQGVEYVEMYLSCPYQITRLSFPLESQLEQFQTNIK
jgi:hypothetical protein